MHDSAHIDALIHGAVTFPGRDLYWRGKDAGEMQNLNTREAATRAGRMLLLENARSVGHLYNMTDLDNPADDGTRPVEYLGYLAQADEYTYDPDDTGKPWRLLPPVALLKALKSYEYQACEHPEWEASEARSFCTALREALCCALPGYEAADSWMIYPKGEAGE